MRNRLTITVGVLGLSAAAWWGTRSHVVATEPIVVRSASLQTAKLREAPGNPQVLVKLKIVEADREAVNAAWKKFAQGKAESALATATTGIYSVQDSNSILTELGKHDGTRLLGEPSITVVSGATTSFINGGEVGIPTIVGVGPSNKKVTTAFRSVGLSTVLTPTALEEGGVLLKVICEWNQLDESTRVAGIPGIKSRRVNLSPMLLKPEHSVIVFVPESDVSTIQPSTDSPVATDSHKEPKRATFVIVTPEVLKPMTADDDSTRLPRGFSHTSTPYAPVTGFPELIPGRLPPVAPPAGWPATPIPFADPLMPMPGVFNLPTQPVELTRLQHLQSAKSHLAQAGLTDQVAAVVKEIKLEQRSLAQSELQRRERELEQLQKELESLRRSLSEDTETNSQ